MKLCHYGCGEEGIFPFTSFYGRRAGLVRCAKSAVSCPANANKIKKSARKAAITKSNKSPEEKQKRLLKWKRSMSVLDENGESKFSKTAMKIANSRREKAGTYKGIDKTVRTKRTTKIKGKDIFQLAAEKTAVSRFGVYAGLAGKSDFEKYRYWVNKFTNSQQLSLLENYNSRGAYGKRENPYQLDHKFSIVQGFLNNIPPYIIGHISNLEMLPARANNSKGSSCSISLDELFKQFDSWQTPE